MTRAATTKAPVLVVDDDADLRAIVVQLLELEGYPAVGASQGREALELLRDGLRPALILLDMMMPVMDGWQFRAAQRNDPDLAHVPVVVFTAHGDVRNLVEELGAAGGVKKPLRLEALLEVIERHARWH